MVPSLWYFREDRDRRTMPVMIRTSIPHRKNTVNSVWLLFLIAFLIRNGTCAFSLEGVMITSTSRQYSCRAQVVSSSSRQSQFTDTDGGNFVSQQPFDRIATRHPWRTVVFSSSRHSRCFIMMGKGDGKKKRKKQSPTAATSSVSSSTQPKAAAEPRRVTNDINVPVKHQIRMAKYYKEMSKKSSNGSGFRKVRKTAYRRTWDEEEIEVKKEERRRKGQDPDWDVILSRNSTSPLVIVDGYNIIHKWPRLKKHMAKGDARRARQLLVDDLENLKSIKGWRIEVVFDGTRRSTLGPLGHGPGRSATSGDTTTTKRMEQATKKSITKHGIRQVFTGVGIEADSYIESRCSQAKNITEGQLTRSFIIATDDSMIRLAGQSAGAVCMSADRFITELKALKGAISHRVEAAVAKANGKAMRPEKLRGTHFHSFGRGSVLIEDKRKRKEKDDVATQQQQIEIEMEKMKLLQDLERVKVEVDENGIPWWAQVPTQK